MKPMDAFIEGLADVLPGEDERRMGDTVLAVDELVMTLPIESIISEGGLLHATLPRGAMSTGFTWPHGRMRVRFARGDT
jgi:hypothetical protein